MKSMSVFASVCLLGFALAASGDGRAQAPAGELTTIELPEAPGKGNETIPVDIFIPGTGKPVGDILVLPGWKFSRTRWHRETALLDECRKRGFRAVFPDMRTTLYESAYYPETVMRWSRTPGGAWIREVLLPELRKRYGLFGKALPNYLLGLSTGGRGVLLVCIQNPGVFRAGATLSGDFDQARMPGDRIMTAVYGSHDAFRKRWEETDNPLRTILTAGTWTIPLYIGHGKSDRVVPFEQSALLHETIRRVNPQLRVVFNAPVSAGHDFAYWGSEVAPALDFFASER